MSMRQIPSFEDLSRALRQKPQQPPPMQQQPPAVQQSQQSQQRTYNLGGEAGAETVAAAAAPQDFSGNERKRQAPDGEEQRPSKLSRTDVE